MRNRTTMFGVSSGLIRYVLAVTMASVPVLGQGYLTALDTNKKVVSDFYRLVIEPRNADLIELYVSPDFVDHDSADQKSPDNVVKMLKALGKAESEDVGPTLRNPPAYVMAQADLVTWVFKQNAPDPKDKSKTVERYTLEVYRIKDRKIIEHWRGIGNLP